MRWISLISLGHSIQMHLLLKCTWNILQDGPHLGHKSNLSNFKKIEIVSSIISDHNAKRIDISYKRKSRDITLPTKVHLVKAMVFPVVMYGCES